MITFSGQVIQGDKRGQLLGFPTANIKVDKSIDLPEGIFAAYTYIEDIKYQSALFIGVRKMYGKKERSIETHIFDFDKNIYNQTIKVEIFQFIRPNQVFKGDKELIQQIKLDCLKAKKLLSN